MTTTNLLKRPLGRRDLALPLLGLLASVALSGCDADAEKSPPPTHAAAKDATTKLAVLPSAAKAEVSEAFAAYERARALLASDRREGLEDHATSMAGHLRAAADALPQGDVSATWLLASAERVEAIASASTLDEARLRFQEASEIVIALGAADPTLQKGLHVFECPMVQGFNSWVQPTRELANPYMGQQMLSCGSERAWHPAARSSSSSASSAPSSSVQAHDGHVHDDGIAYYTCPMHPSVKQDGPGQCPLCGMDLTPITKAQLASGQLLIDESRRREIGLRTTRVTKGTFSTELRTVGRVTFDEARLYDVNLKLSGWIDRLHVDETGEEVNKGQVLFTLYSPDLYAAQVELISAQRAIDAAGDGISKSLIASASKKLALWDVSAAQIEQLRKEKVARRAMPILSPARGHVIEKNVVNGSHVEVGQTVYRIADLRRVWIEADVYEKDLPRVHVGQKARVTLSYLPGRVFEGAVTFVAPVLDESTRTGRVRLELDNDELALKPNMFTEVTLLVDGEEALQIPREAVLYTGRRRLVFIDLGEGRLRPQEVTIGRETNEAVEVLSGLSEGDVVVTSGNFLLAAESRIKNAADFWHDDEDVESLPTPSAAESSTPAPAPEPAGLGGTP